MLIVVIVVIVESFLRHESEGTYDDIYDWGFHDGCSGFGSWRHSRVVSPLTHCVVERR